MGAIDLAHKNTIIYQQHQVYSKESQSNPLLEPL